MRDDSGGDDVSVGWAVALVMMKYEGIGTLHAIGFKRNLGQALDGRNDLWSVSSECPLPWALRASFSLQGLEHPRFDIAFAKVEWLHDQRNIVCSNRKP